MFWVFFCNEPGKKRITDQDYVSCSECGSHTESLSMLDVIIFDIWSTGKCLKSSNVTTAIVMWSIQFQSAVNLGEKKMFC